MFHFVIFTPGRAGSHLLASLLNSHPEIMCEGEFGKKDTLINPSKLSGSLRGCILAFGQRNLLLEWNPEKVIYMTRSPELGSESYAKNVLRYRARIAGKTGKEYNQDPRVTDKEIAATTERLRQVHRASRQILKEFNHLEIFYEELTSGKNISKMPKSISNRVCDFLGVQREELTTDLVKRK